MCYEIMDKCFSDMMEINIMCILFVSIWYFVDVGYREFVTHLLQ